MALRFRSQRTASRPPPNNFGSALQRKATWLVMGLLVFVVLFGQYAWRKNKANQVARTDGHLVDNVVEPERKLGESAEQVAKPITAGDLKLPDAKPLLEGETKRLFGDVSPKLFEEVHDDTTYHTDEIKPIFTLFHKLLKYDDRDIELASIGKRTFVQLFEQPKVYRGEIVTVGGKVVRVTPQLNKPPFPREVDASLVIPKQYEVWIQPDGSLLPIVINCLTIPDDFRPGAEIDASGYFFKRLGYPSAQESDARAVAKGMKNVYRSAPLILAKTIRPRLKPAVAQAPADAGNDFFAGVPLPFSSKYVMPILGIGMVVLTAVSAWAFRISRSSVLDGGPIVGRRRTAAETPTETTNLNSLKLEP